MKLLLNALVKFVCGIILVGLMLFLPAGTFHYPGAWRFIALLFGPMLLFGTVLFLKAPALLEKRLNVKEKERAQKSVVALSALTFFISFILAGLDHRFGWTTVSLPILAISCILLLASYGMYMEVMRENAYLSRTVEVQSGQHVVDTGLYGVIRHPMYTASIVMFLSIPLVLGSWIAFLVMLAYPAFIVQRILNEEKVLSEGLEGYITYKEKVRFRLIPFIW